MNEMRLTFLLIAVIVCCSCTSHTDHFEKGILFDYSEIAGCDFVIKLEEGGNLEPVNLAEFDEMPVDGAPVEVKYNEEPSINSICNAGTVVTLTDYRRIE